MLPEVRQRLGEISTKVPGNSCQGKLCSSSLNKKRLLALQVETSTTGTVNATSYDIDKIKCEERVLWLLYLIIISAEGAARRKLCGGGLWGSRGWPPLTGDGKGSPLVTVQGDDASRFIDHVMHAIFVQPTT